MKKAFIHITAASLLSWGLVVVLNITLRAFLGTEDNQIIRNLIATLYFNFLFLVSLLYVEQIRNGRGEDMFFANYEGNVYTSIKRDIPIVCREKKPYLYVFWIIGAVCFVTNFIYLNLLGNSRAFILSMVYVMPFSWNSIFPSSFGAMGDFCGYLLSSIIVPFLYFVSVLFYRRSINSRTMKKMGLK